MAMDSSARESGMSVQEYTLLGDRVRADTLLSDRVSSGDQGGMHWVRAAAIQATWSTSSSTVLLPWIFGTLGYVGGPLCLVVFVGLALVVQLKVVELAAEHGAMSDMADVGEALAGEPGRRLFPGPPPREPGVVHALRARLLRPQPAGARVPKGPAGVAGLPLLLDDDATRRTRATRST